MFDLVMDVPSYPLFLPWCQEARVLEKTSQWMRADLQVGNGKLSKMYRSFISFQEPLQIQVTQEEGPFEKLQNTWAFDPLGPSENHCQVKFFIDFSFKSGVFNHLMTLVFDKACQKMIQAFEDRAHLLYGSLEKERIK